MPSLICSSRYTVDSQILRKTAQSLGWETLRLDGNTIPDWFEPPDAEIALFYTAPHAFDIARQLDRALLGCNPDWTVNLPSELLIRDLEQTRLRDALRIIQPRFVKHAVSKAFPAGVYDAEKLATETTTIHPDSLVHVGEPVEFECEFRCFVSHQHVNAISPYVYDGKIVADYKSFPVVPETELDDVKSFAESVLNHPGVSSPDAFVLVPVLHFLVTGVGTKKATFVQEIDHLTFQFLWHGSRYDATYRLVSKFATDVFARLYRSQLSNLSIANDGMDTLHPTSLRHRPDRLK